MKQIADQKFITYPCDLVEEGKFWLFDAIVFPIKFPIVTFLNWIPLRMRKNFKVVSDWFPWYVQQMDILERGYLIRKF